jgi:cytochrome c553
MRFRAVRAMVAVALIGVAGPAVAGVAALAAGSCAACHGPTGVSRDPQYPDLAGRKPGYLRLQLRAFRSGSRTSALMHGFAAKLSDAEIAGLAAFYARQKRAPARPAATGLAAAGARLYAARGRGAPPCAACHGGAAGRGFGRGTMGGGMMGGGRMRGMRTDPAITPRLDGRHAAYLAAQLDAFASGARPDATWGRSPPRRAKPSAGPWRPISPGIRENHPAGWIPAGGEPV